MNTDTIYKNIGYVVVLLFGFYIASKSLLFQTKIIEGLTEREKKKKEKEESAARTNQEKEYSQHLNDYVILKTHKLNNPNLKKLKKYRAKYIEYIEQYNKLINNFILHEKISIVNFLLDKYDDKDDYTDKPADASRNSAKNINFNNIIQTLIKKTENIEILEKCIVYLDETTGGELEEDIKDKEEDEDKDKKVDAKEEKRIKDMEDAEEEKEKDRIAEKEKDIKMTNESLEDNNNVDMEFMSSTQSELKNSLLKLLSSYKTEYKIYIVESLLNIYNNKSDNMNDVKVNKMSYNNKVINTLEKSEFILNEIFSGGVSTDNTKPGKKKGKKSRL